MCYKLCKCPGHHLIMKTTILVEERTFRFVGFQRDLPEMPHCKLSMHVQFLCKCGSDWSVIKNTSLIERNTFLSATFLSDRGPFLKLQSSHFLHMRYERS